MHEMSLSPKLAAVALLAKGMTTDAVGAEVGVDGSTVRRWRDRDPEFRADVEAARRAILSEAVAALTSAVRKAVDTLTVALDDDSSTIRVRAASELIRSLPLLASHAELEARLTALEARMSAPDDVTPCLAA